MSEETTQAVVEKPDAAATPAVEGSDARDTGDDLETLLKQFDTNVQQDKPAATSKPEQKPGTETIDPKKIADDVRAQIEADNRFKTDMSSTVKSVRGDLDADRYDDDMVADWIDRQAKNDPRLAQAWRERHSKPQEFAKVTSGLAKKFSDKFGKLPDKAATEDREAVTAAVRGASNRAPEGKAPDYSKSSNHDFKKSVEEQYGYSPRV
jgi:hypothetical protein